jgi:hypothetical protein
LAQGETPGFIETGGRVLANLKGGVHDSTQTAPKIWPIVTLIDEALSVPMGKEQDWSSFMIIVARHMNSSGNDSYSVGKSRI